MAQELKISVSIIPEVDTQNAKRELDSFAPLLQKVAENPPPIVLDLDSKEAQDILAEFARDLQGLELPDLSFPQVDTPDGVKELAESFEKAKKEAEDLLATQQKASAALAAAGQKDTEEYKRLQAEIKKTKAEVEELKEIAEEAGQGQGESIFEKMFKFEAAEQAGEFLGGIAEKGGELRETIKQVQAQTGLMGEEFDAVKDRADALFSAGVGENLSGALKAAGTAQQQLGKFLDPQGLEDFTVRAAGMGKVFDKDVNEVISKGRTFIANFGLDGEEAGDLLALAMQKGGSAMDDILDTTDEYSQLIQQAGFSAQEFVGILTTGVQAGARDTDKLADTIKETQIRLKAGDITKGLAEVATPITATIEGIAKAGEQGKLSVSEVMQQSAAEIERAFNAGEITEAMRSQLQVAISGTPAEDLGSDLYGRIFSAKIDPSQITEQAKVAGDQMVAAIKPTFIDGLGKTFDSVTESAAAIFAPVASGASSLLGVVGQLGPGLSVLKDTSIGKGLLDKVSGLASGLTDLPGLAAKAGPALGSAMTAATGPIGLVVIGLAALAAGLTYFFTQTEAGQEAFDEIVGYVGAFVSGAGELLEAFYDVAVAYLDPTNWFGGDDIDKAKEQLGVAVDKILSDARSRVADSGIGRELEKSLEISKEAADIKVKIQAVADTKQALADFESAQKKVSDIQDKIAKAQASGDTSGVAKLEKDLFAAQTQSEALGEKLSQIPGAVQGINTVADASGKLRTVYDINKKAVGEYVDAQGNAYGAEAQSKVAEYSESLGEIASDFQTQKDELAKLQKLQLDGGQITEKERERYLELADAAKKNGDAMQKAFQDGAEQGLLTDAVIKQYAKSLGITEEAARKMAEQHKETAKAAGAGKKSVDEMGKSFEGAMQKAQAEVDKLQAAYAEMLRTGQNDPAIIDNLRKAQAELVKLKEIQSVADDTAEDIARRAAERAKVRDEIKERREQQLSANRIRRITDEHERTLAQIAEDERAANKAAEIEIAYQNKLAAIAQTAEERDAATAAAEQARQDRNDAAAAAVRARSDEDARFKLEVAQKIEAAEQKQTDATAQAIAARLQLLKDSGITTAAVIQQQKDLELEIGKSAADKSLSDFIASTTAFQEFQAELSAKVTADPAAYTPESIAAAIKAKRAEVAAKLVNSTDPVGLAYQGIVEQNAQREARLKAEYDFRIEEARINALPDQFQREQELRLLNLRKVYEAERVAAGTNAEQLAEAEKRFAEGKALILREVAISAEIDTAERTRQQRLLEAQKTLDAELAFAEAALRRQQAEITRQIEAVKADTSIGDTERAARLAELANQLVTVESKANLARAAANKKFRQSELEADKEFYDAKEAELLDGNAALQSALSFQEGLYKAFYREIDVERQKDLLKQQQALDDQLQAAVESLLRQDTALEDFNAVQSDIARQRAEINKELYGEELSFGESLALAAESAGEAQRARLQVDLDKSLEDTNTVLSKQLDAISASGDLMKADWAEVGESLVKVGEQAGGVILSSWAQLAASGKATLGDFADAAIVTSLKTIRTVIEGNIVGIISAAFAINPFVGIASIPAVFLIEALLAKWESEAKGRLGQHGFAGFAEGGKVHGGRQLIWVNDDEYQRPEIVMRGTVSAAWEAELLRINAGEHPHTVFGRDEPAGIPAIGLLAINSDGVLQALPQAIDVLGAMQYGANVALALEAQENMRERIREQTYLLSAGNDQREKLHKRIQILEDRLASELVSNRKVTRRMQEEHGRTLHQINETLKSIDRKTERR